MFRRQVSPEIEIRLFDSADAKAVYSVVERNRSNLRQWLPWVDITTSADAIRRFIETIAIPQYKESRSPNCGIWIRGEFAGSIGCHAINAAHNEVSIGYWLDAGHQGKGVISDCCAAMLDYLFDELNLHRATVECATGNFRSCAIPERLGFTREGVKREAQRIDGRWLDLAVWSILDREWRQRRGSLPRTR